jgi:hypothetical protein
MPAGLRICDRNLANLTALSMREVNPLASRDPANLTTGWLSARPTLPRWAGVFSDALGVGHA